MLIGENCLLKVGFIVKARQICIMHALMRSLWFKAEKGRQLDIRDCQERKIWWKGKEGACNWSAVRGCVSYSIQSAKNGKIWPIWKISTSDFFANILLLNSHWDLPLSVKLSQSQLLACILFSNSQIRTESDEKKSARLKILTYTTCFSLGMSHPMATRLTNLARSTDIWATTKKSAVLLAVVVNCILGHVFTSNCFENPFPLFSGWKQILSIDVINKLHLFRRNR